MTNFELTGLFVWRNICSLGYPALESFLSAEPMLDSALICVDPTSDEETLKLCSALQDKFPEKTRVIYFEWPIGKTGDGSVIGIASKYALEQVRTSHVINIQADEVYPTLLMEHIKDNWLDWVMAGKMCVQFKILHTERNASTFQGGEEWDGRKDTEVWERGGLINGDRTKGGAGYNLSIKLAKKCPAISFEHDAWSFRGCMPHEFMRCPFSYEFPVIHLHDFARDHYIDIRKNAGEKLWTDEQYQNYKSDADRIEATKDEWWNDPKWVATTSPFQDLLPWYAKELLGKTRYEVNWNLLEEW